MSPKTNDTTTRSRDGEPLSTVDAASGRSPGGVDSRPRRGGSSHHTSVSRQQVRAIALEVAVDLLAAERAELRQQVETLEATVAELEAETESLERTVEQKEQRHRQVVERYEQVIAEKDEAYRELERETGRTDAGDGTGVSLRGALRRLQGLRRR